ncbi:MAG: DUF4397 domain-containing protein [Candidatus Nanopelagicales bacterium]
MRTSATLLGAGALVAASAVFALPASAADTASVSVLHGVPDATVDVCANGEELIPDFEPGTLAGPLDLPAGSYEIKVVGDEATTNCDADALIGPADVAVEGGKSYTIVAHLDADGGLTATPFENDTEAAAAGSGKLTARHVAEAPEVDVLVNGDSVGSFSNPEQIGPAVLPAGDYDVEIQAGGDAVSTTPATDAVPIAEGKNTIAYAWGTADDLQIAVQTVDLGHSAPSGVPGGESGAAANGAATWLLLAGGLGIAGVALSSRRLVANRK